MSKNKNKNTKVKNSSKSKFGIFYVSNGRWTAVPYRGWTFTARQVDQKPFKQLVKNIRNRTLKSRVKVKQVKLAK